MDKAFKQLFVFSISQLWGGEKIWLDYLARLDRSKITPVCVIFGKGELFSRIEQLNIKCYCLPSCRIRNIVQSAKNLVKLTAILKKDKFDAVNSLGVHLLTTLASGICKIPYILHIHTIHRLKAVDRWCLLRAGHIITVSNFSRKFIEGHGVPVQRIRVVHNGIDAKELEAKSAMTQVKQEFGLDKDTLLVCYSGRIVMWKNLELLIELIPRIKKGFNGRVKFLFIGEDPGGGQYKTTLLAMARRLGAEGDMFFTGRREDAVGLLKQIDIFAMPSLLEVCSMSILEAMALGKPVIALKIGGNPELLAEGSGILLEPQDKDGYAAAILELLNNAQKRQELGEAAKKRIALYFEIGSIVRKFEEALLWPLGKYNAA
jgi:glycosyltransferase involved in cell wall biosynthesis